MTSTEPWALAVEELGRFPESFQCQYLSGLRAELVLLTEEADDLTRLDTPAVGGRLMDGVIITQKISSGLQGARIF